MIPVVDVSKYQGKIDFHLMRSKGVQGVICRAGNGVDPDLTFNGYVRDARQAGLKTGAYWFCNPQVGTPELQGRMLAESHLRAGCELPPMLDVESFANEKKTLPAPSPPTFSRWLHVMVAVVEGLAREPFFYSNRAFWDPNVADTTFGRYDIIVARYPFYSPTACAAHVPPVNAQDWDEWIFRETSSRPQVPTGWLTWSGWQFSAGYNGRGATYGVSSKDLDLNIIRDDVWARWLGHPSPFPSPTFPSVPQEDSMRLLTNGQDRDIGDGHGPYPPGVVFYELDDDDIVSHILGGPRGEAIVNARGGPAAAQKVSNVDLDALGAP